MKEEWRPIKGLENYFHVSNMGRVKSLARFKKMGKCAVPVVKQEVILAPRLTRGYPYVVLEVKAGVFTFRRNVPVHRIVAQEFIPNKLGKREVNHINGKKDDNRAENLEWVTGKENVQHAIRLGLKKNFNCYKKFSQETIDQVFELRKKNLFHREIANKLGMGVSTVTHILLGTRRKRAEEKEMATV